MRVYSRKIVKNAHLYDLPTPEHYKLDPQPIDVIKYIARAGRKAGESRDSDLHKAMEYLRMELEDEE